MLPDSLANPLRYLFIDFNSYFASVEQHDDPALRGRPVIVTPLESEHTGAIAASYEAKAIGISRGTSVREARERCPGIIVRPARHERYVAVHNLLLEEIGRHLPIARVYSIDECACRLDLLEQQPERARTVALRMKAGIAERIGPCLRASIGIAPSILLAKLAAELEKPDGLVTIESGDLPEVLAGLPLRAIPGVGEGIAGRLRRANIHDFTSLWRLPPKQARAIWGSVMGERFAYALRGHDIRDELPAAKTMIGHSRVLSPQHQRPAAARIVARALILKAASRLRLNGLHASRLTLGLRLRPEGWMDRECLFPATRNSWVFLDRLDAAWDDALAALRRSPLRHHPIGTVAVHLHGLREAAPDPDLFTPAAAMAADARGVELWERIDALNRRFGKEMVTLATHRGLDLNYLGVKIAFSRVPDALEFQC
jgi:DNA polymerase IV